jgi:hypothetical protein
MAFVRLKSGDKERRNAWDFRNNHPECELDGGPDAVPDACIIEPENWPLWLGDGDPTTMLRSSPEDVLR